MKKKLILLPLLMLALGACGSSTVASSTPSTTSTTTTSTVTTSTTTSETTSEAPVVDTNVYRIVGTVQETAWTADGDDFVFVKDAEENIFTVEGIDLFINDEWAITLNGDWPGQLGFSGATNLTIVDTETTHGEGGGFAVKNFKTLTDGNYDIELNTGVAPRVLTITRVGDPVNVPVVEEDPGEWHLVGTITGTTEETQWVVADTTFALVYDETSESYKGTFEFEANAEFKVISSDHSGWDYARGPANVETDDPAPAWLDLTGGNIKIVEAGNYLVEFVWVASEGATINGVIFITLIPNTPINIPAQNLLSSNVLDEEVTLTEAYIIAVVTGDSSLFVGTPEGTTMINYYSAEATLKTQYEALTVGQFITLTGLVKTSTGGTGANAKTIVPSTLTLVTTPTWIFGEVESVAAPISMTDSTLKTFIDTLETNMLGVVYTFTDVKFVSTELSGPTLTGYDYFVPSTLTLGVNNVGTSESIFMQVGFFKYDIDGTLYNTTDTYTVKVSVLGVNKPLPLSTATSSGKIRLAGYVEISLQTPAV